MSDIRQIRDWRAPTSIGVVYDRLLDALGTDEFGSVVRKSVLQSTVGARRLYLFEATGLENSSLHYFFGEPGLAELLPTYQRWYSRIDPVADAFGAAPALSDVAMQRVRPQDITSSGFRRRFFDEPGIVERVSIIQRGPDSWRGINVARHASDGVCSDVELNALVSLACLVLPMLPHHSMRKAGRQSLTVSEVERRFAGRFGGLTRREREVCARAAVGMSVDATARELGIARTSVLTYRQRAYQRLNVASPLELCGLVMR